MGSCKCWDPLRGFLTSFWWICRVSWCPVRGSVKGFYGVAWICLCAKKRCIATESCSSYSRQASPEEHDSRRVSLRGENNGPCCQLQCRWRNDMAATSRGRMTLTLSTPGCERGRMNDPESSTADDRGCKAVRLVLCSRTRLGTHTRERKLSRPR